MSNARYPAFAVLIVDDEPAWLRSLSMTLEGRGGITNLRQCDDSRKVLELLDNEPIGLVLLDLTMPHLSGEALLARIREEHPQVMVIIVSGLNQVETAVRCVQLGAFDYFVKTVEEERLLEGVSRAIRMLELEEENRSLKTRFFQTTLERPEAFAAIQTEDVSLRRVFRYVESIAGSTQPILITGESGVGKELVANAVHLASDRKGPIITVNVAGLDDNVFSDTLFGHQKGAFTGADQVRDGMVAKAAGGTLFLDEIGDLSLSSQVKLLRLLQEGDYFPLGADQPKQSTARIVVATHQDLAARQQQGSFRRDLYYRLCAHHVHVPPLRDRKGDIQLLLETFLEEAAAVFNKPKPTPPRELATLLRSYHFPGNVRELRSMVFDAVGAHQSRVLSMESFRRAIAQGGHGETADATAESLQLFQGLEQLPTLQVALEALIEEAIRRADGNQTLAARMLGISQPALSKRLRQKK
jgi:DNA-binding NtrC family response regulator